MATLTAPQPASLGRQPPLLRRVLGRLSRRRRTLAAVVLVVILCGWGWWRWHYADPAYKFRLDGVSDPEQVVEFARLAAELREVRDWEPPFAGDPAVSALTDWVRDKNPQAETRADLLRASSQPELAACNGLVQLLPNLSPKDLARWRKAKREDVAAEIRVILRDQFAAAREAAYADILGRERVRALLGGVAVPPYPESPSWSRRTACRLSGKRPPDRDLWVRALIDAAEGQLLERAIKYPGVSQGLPHALGSGEVRFLLRPHGADAAGAGELTSGSELEVWLGLERGGPTAPTRQEWDTGLRLTSVEWEWDGPSPAGGRLRPHPVRPCWPPASRPFVINTTFAEFLYQVGLPKAVAVRARDARVLGPRSSPTIEIDCELSSDEYPGWSVPLTLTLATGAWSEITEPIRQAVERVRRGLIGHLVRSGELAGFPARISEQPGGDGDLRIWLRCNGTGVELAGSVGSDCRLAVGDVPEFDSRSGLAAAVATAEPRVADSPVVVRSARIDRARSEVVIGGVLAGPTATLDGPGFTLTLRPDGSTSVVLGGPPPLRRVAPAPSVHRPEAVEKRAREYIGSAYPKLVPHLKAAAVVGTGTAWLRMGLTISDWPAIELGPVPVGSPDEVPAAVDELLKEESVRRYAASQWHLRDRPVRHRRYGPVHSDLTRWDARNGLAEIECSCTAPGFRQLKWVETARLGPRGWSQSGLDEVVGQIERQLNLLQQGVGVAFLSEKQCVVAAVRPDREAFGPGRWVRLNPLAVAVAADLHLAHLGVSVTASGILIDADGVHLPREVSATYLGTFYTPKFCLSDPTVRIGLEDRSLAVSAKFTPPMGGFQKSNAAGAKPPAVAGPGRFSAQRSGPPREANRTDPPPPGHLPAPPVAQLHHAFGLPDDDPRILRLDNLWLNVLYLQLELKGSLSQSLLQARGRLRALGSTDVACGELSCTLESLEQIELVGELEALAPLPGLGVIPARVNGRVYYNSGKGVFECGVRASVRGHEVSALRLAVFARPGEPYQLRAQGHVDLPGLASGEVKGWSTLDMADYDVAGQLRGPLWKVRLRASPAGLECVCSRDTPAGPLGLRICQPRLDGATQTRVEDELARAGPAAPDMERVRVATEQEERWAKEQFRAVPPRSPGDGGTAEPDEGKKKEDEHRAGGGGYVRLRGVVDVSAAEPRMVRVRNQAREELVGREVVLFQFPHARFPVEPRNCRFRYWESQSADPKVYDILVYDLRAGTVHAIRWDEKDPQINDLTPRLRGMNLPVLAAGEVSPRQLTGRMAAAWDTATVYFRKAVQYPNGVRDPVPVAGGYAFDYVRDVGQGNFTVYTWSGSRGVCRAEIAPPVPDARRTESLYKSLESAFDAESGSEPLIDVVAVHPADHSRFARLVDRGKPVLELPTPSGGKQIITGVLELPTASGVRQIPVASGYDGGPLFPQAAACGNAFFAGHDLAGRWLWLGGRGACIDHGDFLWAVADNGSTPPSAGRLSRARFDDWSDESARLLPREWHQRPARAALTWDRVQEKALADWAAERGRDGFEAHPLGLLIGLANRP